MSDVLVSVIMSAYNEKEEWLRESIESILNQTYKNLEFIIVLDNPQNEMIRNVIQEYGQKDARVVFVPNEKNMGLVASLNRALEYVHGDYVARMDADDICYLDRLEKQVATMESTKADFVLSAVDFLFDGENLVRGIADEVFGPEQVATVMKYGNIAQHSTWLLKKEVYDKLDGYRNVLYCEDLEFALRALQEKVKIVKSKDHVVQYRLRADGVSKSFSMEQAMKARYIRGKYVKGEAVWDVSEEELNTKFSGYSEEQKQKYNKANDRLEKFSQSMAEGKWGKCFGLFLGGFFTNKYFRMLFVEYFKSWVMRKRLNGKGFA